ncbi:MAG: hypothetical protein J6Q53_04795 [Oscillospiraceae bacterium]|nr:hypothetical protein [Oscillospiraceae bacterium]
MAKSVKQLVKEANRWRKNDGLPPLSLPSDKPKVTTSEEKRQNIQFKKEAAEFEKVTDIPTGSEIFADQAERIRDLYSQQQRKDVQRKKDEQEWAKVEVDSAQLKKEQAEKALADFEQKSDIDWTDANARKRYDSEMDRRQAAVDRANEEIRQREEAEVTNADVQELASWSDEDKALLDDYISKRQSAFVQSLNPAASGLPADFESNPLIAKYGRKRLDEIASTYQRQRNQEKYQAAEQAGKDAADSGWIGNIAANAASVGANLADTLLDPLARIAQGAGGRDERYSSLDPYAGGQARAFASGVRQETAQNIEGEDPTALSKGLSIGYQGMMSAADSLARGIVGGSPTVGAGLAALGSFNQTLSQASARGASPQQAVALATVNAGIEAATEKIPLDELFDIAKGGAKPAGQAILNVLKQMGIEATTEELSLLGTTLAEAAILREKSGHKQQIADMIANGMSYQEAKEQANKAWLEEAKQTALVSGVAGIFGGAGAELGSARFVGQDPVQMTAMELAGNQQPQTAPAAEEVQPASFLEASAQQLAEQAPKAAPVELTPEQQMLEQAAAQTVSPHADVDNGSVFDLPETTNEAGSSLAGESPETSSLATPINPASTDRVPQITEEVNGNIDETSAQDVDIQEQSAEGGQVKGTGAAEQHEGTVGAKESQFRHEVKQSKIYGNTYKNTPYDDIRDIGRSALKDDPNVQMYDVITEAESIHEADLRTETGRDRLAEYHALMKKDGWTGADNDTAMKLLTTFRKEGKADRVIELRRKQREMGTQAGQMAQSFAKYSREDATVAVLDAIDDLDDLTIDQVDKTFWKPKQSVKGPEAEKRDFQKWKDGLSESLLEVANDIENVKDGDKASMQDLIRQIANLRHTTAWAGYSTKLTARTEKGLQKMDFETLKAVAKTQIAMIPNDFRKRSKGEMAKAARVHNMLFTLTTKFKNDAGNITTGLMDAVSDSFAGRAMDTVLSKYTGQRTVANDLKYAREYSKAANDAADVAAAFVSLDIPMDTDTKYSIGRTRTFSSNTNNPFMRFMSAYEKHLKYALEVSDKFYEGGSSHVVSKSLEGLGQKSGLTADQIQSLGDKVGQRRTFKDPGAKVENQKTGKLAEGGRALARANTGIQKALNNIGTSDFGLGDLVQPFAAVSGEVKQVGIDYTGGGLISGITEMRNIIKDVKNGKQIDPYRQRTAATNFGRGLSGTVGIALFTGLAAVGAIKVHDAAEYDEKAMEQAQGLSGAQLNLDAAIRYLSGKTGEWESGDQLITVDFLEPLNTLMHIGYLISEGDDIPEAVVQGNFESLLDMPMMQTVSDLADLAQSFTEVSEGNMDSVYDAAGQLVGNMAGGIIPNWVRKTAQVVDPYYRDTYDTDPFKKAGKELLAAIPGASKLLPEKYDALGNVQKRYDETDEDSTAAHVLDTLITPWDTQQYQTDEIYQEIKRLNEVSGENVTPPSASRRLTYTDTTGEKHEKVRLTEEQYQTLAKTQGQTAKRIVESMISSKDYAAMTDEQKAKAIQQAYQYARKTGEIAAIGEDHTGYGEVWMEEVSKGKEAEFILRKVAGNDLSNAMDSLQNAWKKGYDASSRSEKLEWAYNAFADLGDNAQKEAAGWVTGAAANYIDARDHGISHDDIVSTYKLLDGIKPESGYKNPRTIQKAEAIANTTNLAENEKAILIKQQVSDSQDKNIDELKELGYGVADYVKLYRDHEEYTSGTGKKKRTAQKWANEYGISLQAAYKLYEVFS